MSTADVIKKIRLTLCLEQSEFSELIGICKQSIWHYEKGTRQPRLQTIRKIMNFARKNKIKVELDDFFKE